MGEYSGPPVQRVLLLGGTGLTGHHCLKLLLADTRVSEVRVLTRRPLGLRHEKLVEYYFDEDFSQQQQAFEVQGVICCLGTTMKSAGSKAAFRHVDFDLCVEAGRLAKQAGVSVFGIISAVNANARSPSFYARTKGKMEQALKELALPSLVIAQPSLLLGKRAEKRTLEALGQSLLRPTVPLLRHISPTSTPIHAEALAAALVESVLQPPTMPVLTLRYSDLMKLSRSVMWNS